MANIIQKFIYNLSSVVPVLLIFSLVWKIQKNTNKVSIVLIVIAFVLIFLFVMAFTYGKQNLAPINIRTIEIAPYDSWIFCYIITYLVPMTSLVIDEWNITILGILAVVIAIAIPYFNSSIPNPLLAIRRYHFYRVSAENGISDYVIITKKKYRNKNDLKTVNRVFDFLLLDMEVK